MPRDLPIAYSAGNKPIDGDDDRNIVKESWAVSDGRRLKTPAGQKEGNRENAKAPPDQLFALTIFSPDPPYPKVSCQYNPKELQVERAVPWTEHKTTNSGQPAKKGEAQNERGALSLEFTGTQPRNVTVEMLFDGYEKNQSVIPQLSVLEQLATVRDGSSKVEEMRRPYRCVVVWGEVMRNFRCVIENLSIKYQMISPDGKVLRATATVKLKEADIMAGFSGKGK